MTQRTTINIGAIIAAITAAVQFLPQLMQIIESIGPLIEQLKQLFAEHSVSMTTFGTAAGVIGYQGYQAYRERGVAHNTLSANNRAFASVLTELSTLNGPEAEQAVDLVTKAMALHAKAGAGAIQMEAAARKTADPQETQKKVADIESALRTLVGVVQELRTPADKQDGKSTQ